MLAAAHDDDLRAAQSHGLRTGFIPRPTEHGPRQTRDVEPAGAWDVTAAGLVQLAERMGA